jgi:hypothetical protein
MSTAARKPITPLTDDEALARLRRVQGLDGAAFDDAIRQRLGPAMSGVFGALVRSLHPDDNDDAVAEKLQLMFLAWLMATDTSAS